MINKYYLFDAVLLWFSMAIFSILLVVIPGTAIATTTAIEYEISMRVIKFSFIVPLSYSLQAITNRRLVCKNNIVLIVNYLLWSVVTPVIVCKKMPSLTADITFGMVSLISFVCLKVFICNTESKICSVLYAFLIFFMMFLGSSELIHYIIFNIPIQSNSVTALFQTNVGESIEWLNSNFNIFQISIVFVVLPLIYFLIYSLLKESKCDVNKISVFVLITLVSTSISLLYLFPKTHVMSLVFDEITYNRMMVNYLKNRKENIEKISFLPNQGNKPRTVIVVIGESSSRDFMKAYNENYIYNNTPWMDKMKICDNSIFFGNAYSSYNLTVISVPRILTTMSQYNSEKFESCMSIIDVARKAGYKTYWISNQDVGKGRWDASISMLANTSDCIEVAKDENGSKAKYDEYVLPLLKNIDSKENNFIIIHLKGSHTKYDMRYPESFSTFDDSLEGKYATSILYTDYVLKGIYEFAKNNLNLDVMLYTSDHGEDMQWQHGTKQLWNNYHVPYMIWVSDKYKKECVRQYNNLIANHDKALSNDMVYNTLCGMLNIRSNYYDDKEDCSSEEYAYDRDNVKVVSGRYSVKYDSGQEYIDR